MEQFKNKIETDLVTSAQQEVRSFVAGEYTLKDAFLIKSEYKRLKDSLLDLRWSLEDQLGKDHGSVHEIRDLEDLISRKSRVLFYEFVEEELKNDKSNFPEGNIEEIERQSNYQGNMTQLMIERLKSPDISNQLQRILLLDRLCNIEEEDFDPKIVSIELKEDLEVVANDTPVTFVGNTPSANSIRGVRETMDVAFCDPFTDKELNVLQNSYTEAHEKGHYVRRLTSNAVAVYFSKSLDLNQLHVSQEYFQKMKKYLIKEHGEEAENITIEDVVEMIKDYFALPVEILERMSQLKNYFGFSSGEIFTRQHLQYAREHYISDTGMDNHMEFLFDCITPETEERFLKIMNNYGV